MGSEWKPCRVGDLIEVKHGWAFKGDQMHENMSSGPVVVAIGNFEYTGGFRFDSTRLKRYSGEFPKEYVLSPGDILLAMTCQTSGGEILGIPGVIPDDESVYLHNQRLGKVLIKDCDKIEADLLYWLFLSPSFNHHLFQTATGTKILHTSPSKIEAYEFLLPPKQKRVSIANTLWSLNNKIALNRQINTTLESMAQALFKSWFVDFDPVIDNALATGNEIPEELQARADRRRALLSANTETAAARLPQDIQQLFPDRFVFTEDMGWVPEGWEVASLDSVTTELRRGISPKYLEKGGVRVVNQKCIRNHLIDFSLTRRNDPSLRKVEGRKLEVGDVLVNSTGVGTLGRMAQVLYLAEPTVVDSHVTVVRPNTRLFSPFTFGQALQSVESLIEAMGEGSTGQTELSRKNLQEFKLLLPSLNCQKAAEPLFISFAEKIQSNLESTEILANLRDSLLPKLLSGQLSIPEAEQALDEVN